MEPALQSLEPAPAPLSLDVERWARELQALGTDLPWQAQRRLVDPPRPGEPLEPPTVRGRRVDQVFTDEDLHKDFYRPSWRGPIPVSGEEVAQRWAGRALGCGLLPDPNPAPVDWWNVMAWDYSHLWQEFLDER